MFVLCRPSSPCCGIFIFFRPWMFFAYFCARSALVRLRGSYRCSLARSNRPGPSRNSQTSSFSAFPSRKVAKPRHPTDARNGTRGDVEISCSTNIHSIAGVESGDESGEVELQLSDGKQGIAQWSSGTEVDDDDGHSGSRGRLGAAPSSEIGQRRGGNGDRFADAATRFEMAASATKSPSGNRNKMRKTTLELERRRRYRPKLGSFTELKRRKSKSARWHHLSNHHGQESWRGHRAQCR